MNRSAFVSLALLALTACGGDPPAKTANDATDNPSSDSTSRGRPSGGGGGAPQMTQELGSMDLRAVEKMFNGLLNGPLESKCHAQGRGRVEYLAGDVKLFTRITQDGKVKYGYFEDTSVGDRDTEKCILDVLKDAPWPKPVGGEGEVRNQMSWTGGDERPPAAWTADKVTGALDKDKVAKDAVTKCTGGSTGFKITGYVEPGEVEKPADPAAAEDPKKKPGGGKKGGKPEKKKEKENELEHGGRFKSVGMSVNSKENAEKIDCLVDALKTLSLPSPGSYAAKVSFSL